MTIVLKIYNCISKFYTVYSTKNAKNFVYIYRNTVNFLQCLYRFALVLKTFGITKIAENSYLY